MNGEEFVTELDYEKITLPSDWRWKFVHMAKLIFRVSNCCYFIGVHPLKIQGFGGETWGKKATWENQVYMGG